MASFNIPNEYAAVAPIIVTSPTARCGTTLIQRLLSSGSNGLVYGENLAGHMNELTALCVRHLRFVDELGDVADKIFDQVLSGDLDDWRPGLMPPLEVSLKALSETYYQTPLTVARHAESIGRPIWGVKYPAYSRDMIKAMLQLMPNCRFIYVFRNLFDVLKSMKARKFVKTDQDVIDCCVKWATNMKDLVELANDDRILFLKYEGLIAQRDDHVQLLQLFTGIENLSPAAFDVKVNTFRGDEENGHSPSQYIEPEELTASDREAIFREAGPVMEHLYGDMMKAA